MPVQNFPGVIRDYSLHGSVRKKACENPQALNRNVLQYYFAGSSVIQLSTFAIKYVFHFPLFLKKLL